MLDENDDDDDEDKSSRARGYNAHWRSCLGCLIEEGILVYSNLREGSFGI